ncbi:MAG: ATP-binding protein [Planctomycetota bacterium]
MENLAGLIVIDEIQRRPDLFPVLRALVDAHPRQRYLILGSASPALLRQGSESLAGRIGCYVLGGLRLEDVGPDRSRKLWLRGGFPRAYSARSDRDSRLWRDNYLTAFLERDIPQLGISIPAATLRRFWTMLSHYHGQVLNYAELARSFGISDMTARKYVAILEGTFMVRLLQPWHVNTKKRLVKSPKLYIRDTGLLHALYAIETEADLMSHNKLGASWEGFALESVCRHIGKSTGEVFFWATHNGAELDLYWQDRGRAWGVEIKYADAPRITPSMRTVLQDLELAHLWVVYPGTTTYSLSPAITVLPIGELHKITPKPRNSKQIGSA